MGDDEGHHLKRRSFPPPAPLPSLALFGFGNHSIKSAANLIFDEVCGVKFYGNSGIKRQAKEVGEERLQGEMGAGNFGV